MIEAIILAVGLVLILEGLVIALAPSRLDELLARLAEIPVEARRTMGLLAVTVGGIIAWIALWVVG
jgi:uncharacterized protein YjeT (DUF2065 family)